MSKLQSIITKAEQYLKVEFAVHSFTAQQKELAEKLGQAITLNNKYMAGDLEDSPEALQQALQLEQELLDMLQEVM